MIRIIFFNEINITVYLFINYEFKEEEELKKNQWEKYYNKSADLGRFDPRSSASTAGALSVAPPQLLSISHAICR